MKSYEQVLAKGDEFSEGFHMITEKQIKYR